MTNDYIDNLPKELHYIYNISEKYNVSSESDVVDIYEMLIPSQLEELKHLGDEVYKNGHYAIVNSHTDLYPITEYIQSARLYFLFMLLDELDIIFD